MLFRSTLVGYPQAKEEVLANGEQVSDDWLVVASESLQQDRLTVEYNWLYGRQTCRYALFLQFLTPGALAETALLPGSVVAADVAFYKGVTPTRVLFREQKGTREPFIPSGKGCCAGFPSGWSVPALRAGILRSCARLRLRVFPCGISNLCSWRFSTSGGPVFIL